MKGFQIITKYEGIDEVKSGAGQFILKACNEGLEIFQVLVKPGKSMLCMPQDSIAQLNACIIISGEIRHEISGRILRSGDMYTFQDIDEVECFKTIEESLVVMIAGKGHYYRKLGVLSQFYEQIDKIHERDGYTGAHCESVGNLAAKLASVLKFNDQQTQDVLLAGKVHDVGKIKIPDSILNKPGKLTFDEYEMMKQHTLYAYEMVMENTSNCAIAKIVRSHHERLNGSGYPSGLKGDEISIETRVISVVDSFHAMTSERPYKKAMRVEDALIELQQQKGTLYDPLVVDALAIAVNI